MTVEKLKELLVLHDNGVLKHGGHKKGGRDFCALEFDSIVRGRSWTDAPITLPDLRPINDSLWVSDAQRTAALLPVMAELWDWSTWSREKRTAWATEVVIQTVQQLIADLPKLPKTIKEQCRKATNIQAAYAAANAAANAAEAANAAVYAAEAADAAAYAAGKASDAAANTAAYAAGKASDAAANAAADAATVILQKACKIWTDAAKKVAHLK